jgi:Uma2 family endonuclease
VTLYRPRGIDAEPRGRYGEPMKQTPLTARRWTRKEYDRLGELGMFDGEPLELIGGELIVAEPKGPYHAGGVGKVADAVRAALPSGWIVRCQDPIALDNESEPEPDIAVVAGSHTDYLAEHPRRPALVIEVADSSLSFDRRRKSSLYARGGVHDYWIVNLIDRVVEVHRDPVVDASAPYGWRYRSSQRVTPPATVTLLALPAVSVAVSDLLP